MQTPPPGGVAVGAAPFSARGQDPSAAATLLGSTSPVVTDALFTGPRPTLHHPPLHSAICAICDDALLNQR